MALFLHRQASGSPALQGNGVSDFGNSKEAEVLKITQQELVEKYEGASCFQKEVMEKWSDNDISSFMANFSSPDISRLRLLLSKYGFAKQAKISLDSDVKDFALGLCFRVAHINGLLEQSMIIPEGFDSLSLAEDVRDKLGISLIQKKPIKLSLSMVRKKIKKETALRMINLICVTFKPSWDTMTNKPDSRDVLYALLWIDANLQNYDNNKSITADQISGIGSCISGEVASNILDFVKGETEESGKFVRQITLSNGVTVGYYRDKFRQLGSVEPGKCPAMSQSCGKVCGRSAKDGAYCGLHGKKTFPRLKSAEPRLLKAVKQTLDELMFVHGHEIGGQGGREGRGNPCLAVTLEKLLIIAKRNKEPWNDLSSTFLDQSDEDILDHEELRIKRPSITQDKCDSVTRFKLVSANVDGNDGRPNEFEKSRYIKRLIEFSSPTLLFLQEVFLVNLVKDLENGLFIHAASEKEDMLLENYSVVKALRKPDACLVYDKTIFKANEGHVSLTKWFDAKYQNIKILNLRSGMKIQQPLLNRYAASRLTVLATGEEFLCVSFHGIKVTDKATKEGFLSPQESTIFFVDAVHSYVEENEIPALIGGDFNLEVNIMLTKCTALLGDSDLFEISKNHSDGNNVINYFLLLYPSKARTKLTQWILSDWHGSSENLEDKTTFNHVAVKSTLTLI